jgi:hypothetical protein
MKAKTAAKAKVVKTHAPRWAVGMAAARRVVLEVLRELWPAIPVTVLTDEAGL